jgi:hypothetical protein
MAKTKTNTRTNSRAAARGEKKPAIPARTIKRVLSNQSPSNAKSRTTLTTQAEAARQTVSSNATKEGVVISASEPTRISKQGIISKLLCRADGAAMLELTEATGWLPHSVRAAMSGLRKAGCDITRGRGSDGVSRFRIVSDV